MNPLKSPLLITNNNNNKRNATSSMRILNIGRFYSKSSSNYLPKDYHDTNQIISWIQHLIQQFEEVYRNDNHNNHHPSSDTSSQVSNNDPSSVSDGKIWFIINETLCLKKIPINLIQDDRAFRRTFFPLVITLLSYHISVVTGIDQEQFTRKDELLVQIQQFYRHQYGYYLGNEVYSLAELIQEVEEFSLYIGEDEENVDDYVSQSLLGSSNDNGGGATTIRPTFRQRK